MKTACIENKYQEIQIAETFPFNIYLLIYERLKIDREFCFNVSYVIIFCHFLYKRISFFCIKKLHKKGHIEIQPITPVVTNNRI